mmetsp:Transcript_8580/g.28111  ORF Transcript_8580/g.28111 Transcript_8580/m.28111 type:complete len:227 (-) Transcript_8580:143-823(-)|eukprot:CAMPEP_0118899096 /NCGR_PEP_ID=MMETSP1166-20130328/5807_1 /TAXON_ID=1104430 /ORGANISM="Chrysoreinhardia sp, Strain CCMP3193" /LENGTH=226 /DNA_ID=CAMNT_0006838217 /DNA_START=23 /DNA_END=703 /DNA_ORIENTATION=+
MPVSKRAKKVTLSKTRKKEASTKRSEYVAMVRSCLEEKTNVFGLRLGARATGVKQLRKELRASSRLFLGKRRLMELALGGTSAESEIRTNFRKVAGARWDALVATDADRTEVEAGLAKVRQPDFAVAGFVPATHIALEDGPLDQFPTSMCAQLTKLGLAVHVKDAKLHLHEPFRVAQPGSPLTPEQAKLLKLLDIKLDIFEPQLTCAWTAPGTFHMLSSPREEEKT